MSLKVKRILALCVCCVLLAAAIYQNVRHDGVESGADSGDESEDVVFVQDYNSEEADSILGDGVPTGVKCDNALDYIAGLRIEREADRSAYTEECLAIIDDTSSTESEILSAQDEILTVNSITECEDALESALKNRGYDDVYVGFGDDGFIDVVLVAENITQSEVETIATVVYSQTEISPEYLTVSSVY
ncbi:MAG: SpoIIIAH-like family protein [Ruminococcaceae bacterium]|nr:SpoIIIAH-like family protein [Oscillospiraceae bacterium]